MRGLNYRYGGLIDHNDAVFWRGLGGMDNPGLNSPGFTGVVEIKPLGKAFELKLLNYSHRSAATNNTLVGCWRSVPLGRVAASSILVVACLDQSCPHKFMRIYKKPTESTANVPKSGGG